MQTAQSLLLSDKSRVAKRIGRILGQSLLFGITCVAALGVLFIIFFIARDAVPFFEARGFREFFASVSWDPAAKNPTFGSLAIFVGSGLVTVGAILVAVPLGVSAAICLSDVLPFGARQLVKPIIEILAAIPSVAYGFFALVVFAPLLQESGGAVLEIAWWIAAAPVLLIAAVVASDLLCAPIPKAGVRKIAGVSFFTVLSACAGWLLLSVSSFLSGLEMPSGTNALNVSLILGIMALPTIVSVSEDALQAVGRELREGSYALGATRAETIVKTVLPAASSGILAAVLLGIMRALGETMVVWMASGNSPRIPTPWYNLLDPVKTLTATIAGEMGEADHVTGSDRYHVLFAMALCLLLFCFVCNLVSEWVVIRERKKLSGE